MFGLSGVLETLSLRECGYGVCQCGKTTLLTNLVNGLCTDCRLLATGKYNLCKCGGIAKKPYKTCTKCAGGYYRATVVL